jgi:hypothetical protein
VFVDVGTPYLWSIATGPRQRSHSGPSLTEFTTVFFLSQISDTAIMEVEVSAFISPISRMAQLCPKKRVPFSTALVFRRVEVEVFEPRCRIDRKLRPALSRPVREGVGVSFRALF